MSTAPFIARLTALMREPLPGHDTFRELSGYQRPDLDEVMRRTPPPRESAVLVLFYPKSDLWHTLLMLRPTYEGVHSGQVSFPGGKREPDDATLLDTAVREFREETGAAVPDLRVIGELSRVFIPPSNTVVTPVVGWCEHLGTLRPDTREVARLIETSMDELLREDLLRRRSLYIQVLGREAEVPYWDIQGQVVWGATALMIAELRELLHRVG